jgi:putative transposase
VIRNAMRFVSYSDRKAVVRAMKEIYTAPTLEAAELGLDAFDKKFGTQYPGAVDVWRHAWTEFIPSSTTHPSSGKSSTRRTPSSR